MFKNRLWTRAFWSPLCWALFPLQHYWWGRAEIIYIANLKQTPIPWECQTKDTTSFVGLWETRISLPESFSKALWVHHSSLHPSPHAKQFLNKMIYMKEWTFLRILLFRKNDLSACILLNPRKRLSKHGIRRTRQIFGEHFWDEKTSHFATYPVIEMSSLKSIGFFRRLLVK